LKLTYYKIGLGWPNSSTCYW